jgi:hypothetical protein
MPVVVVTGMRQVGKSTMLLKDPAFKGRRYVSLDEFAELDRARRDPEGFVRREGPLTIDEAQRCPELLLGIKREVDRERRAGRFLLSGSANFALLRGASESLAGRALYLEMHPFSMRELHGAVKKPAFLPAFFMDVRLNGKEEASPISDGEVLAGGLPPAALARPGRRTDWLAGFEQTYVERDIRQLSQVADLVAFQRVVRLAALRTGQILQPAELARDAQLNVPTVSRYIRLLETSYLLHTIGPFLANRATRLIKSPKCYISDSGLACHLAGVASPADLKRNPRAGQLLETYVAQNLWAILAASWRGAQLSFWHIQGRHEVDFVVESGEDCLAIEVKSAGRWHDRDLTGLKSFLDRTPRCRAGILGYNGTTAVRLGERLYAIPLRRLLS